MVEFSFVRNPRTFQISFLCFIVITALSLVRARAQFINEIHYDNIAQDEGESVEIAAPAGKSLSGYSLYLYNGLTGTMYGSVPIYGSVSDQCHGWGFLTVVFPPDGLQNGAPDGLALVDSDGKVLEFLSYEGSFAAVNGPAAGTRSTDMDVQQSFATPRGYSLQRVGTGNSPHDFVWAGPLPSTFNDMNVGQQLLSQNKTQIPSNAGEHDGISSAAFINEFHYRNNGTDQAEGIEVAAKAGTSLDKWKVVIYRLNGEVDKSVPLSGKIEDLANGWGVLFFPFPKLRNNPGIALVDCGGTIVEFVSPMHVITIAEGAAKGLKSTKIGVSEPADSLSTESLQRRGSGKSRGDFIWVGPVAQSFGNINNGQQFLS